MRVNMEVWWNKVLFFLVIFICVSFISPAYTRSLQSDQLLDLSKLSKEELINLQLLMRMGREPVLVEEASVSEDEDLIPETGYLDRRELAVVDSEPAYKPEYTKALEKIHSLVDQKQNNNGVKAVRKRLFCSPIGCRAMNGKRSVMDNPRSMLLRNNGYPTERKLLKAMRNTFKANQDLNR